MWQQFLFSLWTQGREEPGCSFIFFPSKPSFMNQNRGELPCVWVRGRGLQRLVHGQREWTSTLSLGIQNEGTFWRLDFSNLLIKSPNICRTEALVYQSSWIFPWNRHGKQRWLSYMDWEIYHPTYIIALVWTGICPLKGQNYFPFLPNCCIGVFWDENHNEIADSHFLFLSIERGKNRLTLHL